MTERREDIESLEQLLSHARRLTRAEAGTIYVRDEDRLHFTAVQNDVLAGRPDAETLQLTLRDEPLLLAERSIASYVAFTRATVNVPDVYEIPLERPYVFDRRFDDTYGYRSRSMLAMPLRDARGRVWGVIQLINALDEAGQVVPFDPRSQEVVESLVSQVPHLAPPKPGAE